MVIGLAGPKLAGKSVAAAFFVNKYQAHVYSLSGILINIAKQLHLVESRENLIKIATGLRSSLGDDILAQTLQEEIKNAQPPLAVIDAIRYADELCEFQKLPHFNLIYIDAALPARYARAKNRREKVGEDSMTFDQFQSEEKATTEQAISTLQLQATISITNDASLENFYEQLRQVFKKLVGAT